MCVQAACAISYETRLSSLGEEFCRRLRNTSLKVSTERKMEIMEAACTKMVTSGHKPAFIRKAAIRGISSYLEKVKKSSLPVGSPGYSPLYQNASWNYIPRARCKAMKRKTWYCEGNKGVSQTGNPLPAKRNVKKKKVMKDGNEKIRTTMVVFIPSTKGDG